MEQIAAVIDSYWKVATIGGAAAAAFWRYAVLPLRRRWQTAAKLIQRVIHTCDKVDVISKALGPNGGLSLADQITDTRDGMLLLADQMRDVHDHVDKPIWNADKDGNTTRVNDAFEKAFGYSHDELLGTGWMAHLSDGDRDRVMREFALARQDRRLFTTLASLVTSSGALLRVVIKGLPTVSSGRVVGWRGSIEVVKAVTEVKP